MVGFPASGEEVDAVLDLIDEETSMSVQELSDETGYSPDRIQLALESLMEQGKITSTPDWQYRRSRRSRDQ